MKDLKTGDLEKAAKIIARGCFSNNGQNFNSIKRVFLDKEIAEEFQSILLK
jgi:acyl-CoA reductase-like NAD-dependent aldehyde dehydrogenase